MYLDEYFKQVDYVLQQIRTTQREKIEQAADVLARALTDGGGGTGDGHRTHATPRSIYSRGRIAGAHALFI